MKAKLLVVVIVAAGIVAGAAAIAWWQGLDVAPWVAKRLALPGEIFRKVAPSDVVRIGEKFRKYDGLPSTIPGAWPWFRGPNRDNIFPGEVSLAESWPEGGPPLLWSVELGEGYAGPAVRHGRVYVLDYDGAEQADSLRCFSLDDGREIWRRWYKVRIKRNHGMSRTVPAVSERFAVTIGPRCHVMCVDAASGDFKWGIDLAKDHGAKVPMWYTGQCPLLDGDQVVLAVGGKDALLMGVDCATGEVAWRTPNPKGWEMSHSSVAVMRVAGRRMYLYAAIGGLVGVSAEQADRGAVLWETAEWKQSVISPSPVPLEDGRFLVTAGYGSGSAMFRIAGENGKFAAQQLLRLDKKVFACEQQTPIFYKGYLYSILPADAGALKRELVCMDPDGKLVWNSGQADRFGLGPFMIAGGNILVLEDNGMLTMAKVSEKGYIRLAQARVLQGKEAWAPLALVDGRLLLRDYGRMICLDLKAR